MSVSVTTMFPSSSTGPIAPCDLTSTAFTWQCPDVSLQDRPFEFGLLGSDLDVPLPPSSLALPSVSTDPSLTLLALLLDVDDDVSSAPSSDCSLPSAFSSSSTFFDDDGAALYPSLWMDDDMAAAPGGREDAAPYDRKAADDVGPGGGDGGGHVARSTGDPVQLVGGGITYRGCCAD
jgi:hypothetical protein